MKATRTDWRNFFPSVSRGHSAHNCTCTRKEPSTSAKFSKQGVYTDGHYSSQATSERAHREGMR